MSNREVFEEIFTAFPYEYSNERFSEDASWPGQYMDHCMQQMWIAWQASRTLMRAECIDTIRARCVDKLIDSGVSPSFREAITAIEEL